MKTERYVELLVVFLLAFSLAFPQIVFAQQKALPPGIQKKESIPGKGAHKGWEQGKHKGWKNQNAEIEDPQVGEDIVGNQEIEKEKKEGKKKGKNK